MPATPNPKLIQWLMLQVRQGTQAEAATAFQEIVDRFAAKIIRNRMHGFHKHDADRDDCYQAALIKIMKGCRAKAYIAPDSRLCAYMAVWATHAISEFYACRLKASRIPADRLQAIEETDPAALTDAPSAPLELAEQKQKLTAIMQDAQLTPTETTALQNVRIQGLSYEEAASRAGTNQAGVHNALQRGMRKMRAAATGG